MFYIKEKGKLFMLCERLWVFPEYEDAYEALIRYCDRSENASSIEKLPPPEDLSLMVNYYLNL